MCQCEVRPPSGRVCAVHPASQQQSDSANINRSFLKAPSTHISVCRDSIIIRVAAALIIACGFLGLSGCAGITFNPNASQGSSSGTPTAAALTMISCGVHSLSGAQTKSCSVYLSGTATESTVVSLSSSNTALRLPSSVVVQKDEKTAQFSAVSQPVTKSVSVTITGSAKGVTETDVIDLDPDASTSALPTTLKEVSCAKQTLTGAATVSCSVSLTASATSQTAVKLSSDIAVLKVPKSISVGAGKSSSDFTVTASAVTAAEKATLTASADGVTKSYKLLLYPASSGSQNSAAKLSGLSCGTQSLTGAQTKACSVMLSADAKSKMVVRLTSNNSALQVPASVTVAKGDKSATFNATSTDVKTTRKVTLSAVSEGVAKTDVITVYPAQAANPILSKVACATQTMTGPTSESCSVYLSAAATSSTIVTLSSSKSALQVPVSVTIASGSTSAAFTAKALSVSTTQAITLSATSNGVTQSELLQLLGSSSSQASSSSPQVQLTWDAPTSASDPIAGYRVYRATGSSSSYAVLSNLDTQLSYTDSTVQSGNTYEYVVRTVDTNGVLSAPSSPSTVAIP